MSSATICDLHSHLVSLTVPRDIPIMRLPGSKQEVSQYIPYGLKAHIEGLFTDEYVQAPAPSADFSNSENKGLQLGQNFGTMEASFYSDSIRGINIAAGASVFMGKHG